MRSRRPRTCPLRDRTAARAGGREQLGMPNTQQQYHQVTAPQSTGRKEVLPMSMSTALQSFAADQQVAPRWFLGSLAWVKATGDETGGWLSLVEHIVPAGLA